MNYMLSKMIVKEVMVKDPFAISPDMPVEDALDLGQEKGFGAFPVVEDGRLVGVVTESDIVRMMTRVLGVRDKGKKIDIRASAQFGNMKQIMDILDSKKAVLLSLMTLPPDKGENDWLVMLRVRSQDAEPIAKDLEKSGFRVTYVG
jgi:acetoin utilization protein AcuB